ncbi:MAG: DUF6624 domain-containing protein [Gemmatimonadales bacterium]
MIRAILPPFALAVSVACTRPPADQPVAIDSAVRRELLARVAVDQAVRDSFTAQLRTGGVVTPAMVVSMAAVDSANLDWLRQEVRARGLPTRARVGEEGVRAATLLIQHADADPGFQAEVLPALEVAYRAGDVTGEALALLTDRVAKAQGRPQRYGTQATMRDGRMVIDPIDDSVGVDARRAALGLPPLARYLEVLDSVYGKREAP